MAARAKKLKYHGKKTVESVDGDGNPLTHGYDRFFYGIPPRDLEEEDIKRLSDEDYKLATTDPENGQGALYTAVEEKKPERRSTAKKKAAPKKEAAAPAAKKEAPKEEAKPAASATKAAADGFPADTGSQGGE